ncbi:hypothetical protein AAV35_000470 [Salimicrobium jeotgali]|uniref:Zinc-finger domain-containing protein n=1 Tax=Salimicrobium jeotgali TaxID=1230341 RepID=K2FIG3_9BACI|nr:hypothetical protein [Salimicrobium jeotgali]AKG03404.1 hypothetical protein AAV35_000470 [Salimicrobium jeotgali]EKE30886.1 hypothetical protein MJ3_11315 [Salimicrobium jeotgali]MBM7697649.1 hypothetical protein [Salimicrobium jeotgali]
MNEHERKIHKLCQELIPVFDELDAETQEIINEHVQYCSICDNMLDKWDFLNESVGSTEINVGNDFEIKPLKKLIHINRGLRLLVILVRVLVLFVISFNTLRFHESGDALALQTFQSATFLFYLPAAIFLLVFTWMFLNKKWFLYSLVVDLVILMATWQFQLFY